MARQLLMTMADSWAEYSKIMFGDKKPSDVQYTETRRAFYAGCITYQGIMNNLPDNKAAAMRVLDKLQSESTAYAAEILQEVAERQARGER